MGPSGSARQDRRILSADATAMKKETWDALLAGTLSQTDNYTYDAEQKTVTAGR